nr:hypothetical protein BaRGS_003882 [Batillaria attramentaria]
MSHFDSGEMGEVRSSLELVPGASLTEGSKGEHGGMLSWSPKHELSLMHRQFLRAGTLLQEQRQTNHRAEVLRFLSHSERVGEGLLRMAALEWPPVLSSDIVTELTVISTLRKQLEDRKGKEDQDLASYLQAMRLVNLQLHLPAFDKKTELSNQLSSLQIAAATLARKQTNFEVAEDLLVRQITLLSTRPVEEITTTNHHDLLPSLTSLLKSRDNVELLSVMRVERESAKLLHALNQPRDALEVISNSVASCLMVTEKTAENGTIRKAKEACGELCSRSLMTLVKWLQADSKLLSGLGAEALPVRLAGQTQNQGDTILANVKLLLESETRGVAQQRGLLLDDTNGLEGAGTVSEGERVMGQLLHLATMESPSLAKAWFMLAGWCYKWGRKTVDNASHGSVELSPEEKSLVVSILPQGTSGEETQRVLSIMSQIHDLGTSEEDISDQDQSLYDDGTETTRKQLLMSSDSLRLANEGCVDQLLEIWKGVVKRIYHLYQLSAKAYFIFLQLNDHLTEGEENEDGNIISTLRLLRLLVKHAWELQGVLETGLAHTPTSPWKGIIPQLFARLSHPENYVRRSVSELLCRVAQDAPHLIVYPAIVGSSSGKADNKVTEESKFLNTYLSQGEVEEEGLGTEEAGSQEDEDDDNAGDDSTNTMLQSCLASIVDTLSQHNPRMIIEVQAMVMELQN